MPLLKAAKARGLTYRVEQCPMPGWTTGDNWHNNIAYTPGTWIALHRICERHGVGDQFRIHYDPSHAILMGQDTRSIFQYLKDAGYNFLIGGFHVKGQVIDAKGVAAGATAARRSSAATGSADSRRTKPADQLNAWKKQTVLAEHELPGTARHDPLAYSAEPHRRLARSPAGRARAAAARRRQHASGRRARVSRRRGSRIASALKPILQGSIAFVRHIDEAAASMFALQHEVLAAQGIPIQGVGRQAYRS